MMMIATVGRWPSEREDEVFAALQEWAYTDEGFQRQEVVVDILGGGPANPVSRMEAYTVGSVIVSREWRSAAEARLRIRIETAGGSGVSLEVTCSDD
jgi:hypothetical protein